MELRFYIDPETGEPHLHRHGVTESEATDVLERPLEDRAGASDARIAIGRTRDGRYLRVILRAGSTTGHRLRDHGV